MTDNIEEVPDISSPKVVDSQSDDSTSLEPAMVTHNDSAEEFDADSGEESAAGPQEDPVWEKRRAQTLIFSDWISKRTVNHTKQEVQKAVENVDEELLSTRVLMARQDSTKIITDPREYQLELFERAKTENVIAVLDTGSGKTLIAVLLLKHIIDIELEDRFKGKQPRISFFLVHCVTLVFQQAAVLENNLDQKVECLCGEMGTDLWSRDTWLPMFTENVVIVCTAEILHQCLMHSFITLDQINLLIFDEAHHAKKNHVYARLIKDYYVSQHPSKRPKIFGMTASPVDSKEDEVKAAKDLEVMLHSQIATASNLNLLRNTIHRPSEVILPYAPLVHSYETALCLEVKEHLGEMEDFAAHFVRAREFTSKLGEWCADQIWAMALAEEEIKSERKINQQLNAGQEHARIEILNVDLEKLKAAKETISNWDFAPTPQFEGNSISPKMTLLLNYLNNDFATKRVGKCIIFVQQRWTARLVEQVLCHLGAHYIRPGLLIGTRTGDAGDVKFNFRQQVNSLNKFRKGETNCLIATSIAEEGLDIPDCNLVIRFDLYTTLIQYIQSRGRARHKDSKYVHMVEKGNEAHLQLVNEMQRAEDKMRHFCEALPADRLLQGSGSEHDFETITIKERGQRRYTDLKSGAILTYATSMVVLAHFVASLPNASHGESLHPIYHLHAENHKFVCEVILPSSSPLHSATGRPQSRKMTARRSAAFEACMMLRKKDLINEYLLSTYRRLLPRLRNAHLAISTKKTTAYDMKPKPEAWSIGRGYVPTSLFITVMELGSPENLGLPCQPLALLTRNPLPDLPQFPLHLQIDKSSNLLSVSSDHAINLEGHELDLLDSFTLQIFLDVFHKQFESNKEEMSYWLAPVVLNWKARKDGDIIDWPTMKTVVDNPEGINWSIDAPVENYLNRYLIDRWNAGRRFFSLESEQNLRALDPVPIDAVEHKHMNNILDYSISLFKKSRERAKWVENQPVVKAHQLLQRIDWLDDFTDEQNQVNTKAWLCLQPLLVSAVPVPFVAMARMFPGIINRIESYLIALEAFKVFELDVTPSLALEALTKSTDHTEEHRIEQILVERSMGKNYERLEFLGDCFLKMTTSISLFTKRPDDNEFEYHVSRMVMICNKNLLKTALEVELYKYIRSASFSRREWYPLGLKLLSGKKTHKFVGEKAKHGLGDKTIADVCEAMIGACLLSGKESGNMDMAVKAVTALVRSEDHTALSWADFYLHYEKPAYQTAESSASHLDLAMQVELKHRYHFKYPRLLRSAFVHPSQPFFFERIPCYQRLEFLGDALLDMSSINFLYDRHPDRDPQWLTEHKMAMVSNKFLAALSVKLGFHKHLRHSSPAIEKANRDYVTKLEEAEAEAKGARDYWTNTKHPPKALSDIVESFVGAIFVDSEFDYREVERFFDAHIRWFFEDISIYDTFANNHPTTYLHKLLTLSFGCTQYQLMAREIDSVIPGGTPTSVAALLIHDEVVADGQASSSKQAKVKASQVALGLMQELSREEYRAKFHCDCDEKEEKKWVGKDGKGLGMVGTAV